MNPTAEIITIGDEILIGQTIDTNSAWIGAHMSQIGIPVKRIVSISDQPLEIKTALAEALERADVVLVTGGLGPTRDDRTKSSLADFFGSGLIRSDEVTGDILQLLSARNVPVNNLNLDQALVPDNCRIIRNSQGTAPGMWFDYGGDKVVVSMPGVPYEMKSMMEERILQDLQSHFKVPAIIHRTVMTTGIPESRLSKLIEKWESSLPQGVSLAYLPSPGVVRLRLSCWSEEEDRPHLQVRINKLADQLVALIPEAVFGFDDISLEQTVGAMLAERQLTLASAESCTGGYLAHLVTRIPGSSAYFKGSVIAYANEIKEHHLHVSKKTLNEHGAVSKEVVEQMAIGIRLEFKVDYAVAISGIAGPSGGSDLKPVGTTWIAVAGPAGIHCVSYLLGEHRERNIQKAALAGLNLLRISLLNDARG